MDHQSPDADFRYDHILSSRSKQQDRTNDRRVRELYRYFQPERSLLSNSVHTPSGNDCGSASIPIAGDFGPPSPALSAQFDATTTGLNPEALTLGEHNEILNSFAQLAALRLDVERVLISVSDRSSQFIIAQSSKSLGAKKSYEFYVGTPLTTETNINIGCFFLLDTKRHNGLTDAEKETLSTLSSLIMDYLKVSRQASESRRAARLTRGLSCFVEGSSSFVVDPLNPSYAGNSAGLPSTPPSFAQRGNLLSTGSLNSLDASYKRPHSNNARSLDSIFDYKPDIGGSSSPPTPFPEWWSGTQRKELKGLDYLELDEDGGVVFFEAGNSPATDIDSGSDYSAENMTPASVLAMSTNEEPLAPAPGSTVVSPAADLDTTFLQQLLRRCSKGKPWSFHQDGVLSSSDDEKGEIPRIRARNVQPLELAKGGPEKWKSIENLMLNLYFPNAARVFFVPLWNAASSQWVFTSAVEMSSALGFSSSIMADHIRSPERHELRSPLHGILAAAEFLSGTNLDEFQDFLLETINSCSRNLLDTMNQVLDFSKIVSLERKSRQLKQENRQSPLEVRDTVSSGLDTDVPTNLGLLAEEVVEGVYLGHAYMGHVNHPESQSDVVVVDIMQNDWTYHTQPGALRRIIMNVFGNAMKYTEAGRVSLHLEATGSPNAHRRQPAEDLVTLTVSDSGKGISEEFLQDTLAVGTGLGLSIVRIRVKSMNGSINIYSRPQEGTMVKITLPLIRPGDDMEVLAPSTNSQLLRPTTEESTNECDLLRHNHNHRRAVILGMEPAAAASHPIWSTLPPDILLADEHILAEHTPHIYNTPLPPLLIICSKVIDYSTARSQWSSLADIVSIITHPCGPHKLAPGSIPEQGQIVLPDHLPDLPLRRKGTLSSESNTSSDEQLKVFDAMSEAPDLTDATSSARSGSIKSTPSILSSAENGQLAVDAVERTPQGYDLIFMDISMPVMNGFEATRAIRALEKERGSKQSTPAIIIALTGLSSERDESEALASGFDLFITKPVSFKGVSKLLAEWEKTFT
ncbi:hypothetical protein BJX99DRAFT_250784 [Aspergillus californicus]